MMRLLQLALVLTAGCVPDPNSTEATLDATSTTGSGTGNTDGSLSAATMSETIGHEPAYCVVSMPIDEDKFPEMVADAVCILRTSCGCDNADKPLCGQDFLMYFNDLRAYATAKGLKYDANCAARRIQEYLAAGCRASDINNHEICDLCYVYSGGAQPSEPCETVDPSFDFGILSTCSSAETECYIGVCTPPGAPEGEWCWGTKGCAAGLACSAQGTICVSAKEGEPCLGVGPSDRPCADGLWCDFTVCRARKSTGSACKKDEECITLSCNGGQCTDHIIACDLVNPMYWPFYIPGPP